MQRAKATCQVLLTIRLQLEDFVWYSCSTFVCRKIYLALQEENGISGHLFQRFPVMSGSIFIFMYFIRSNIALKPIVVQDQAFLCLLLSISQFGLFDKLIFLR